MISKRILLMTLRSSEQTHFTSERYFASKVFKEKYAKVYPLKTPTMIALDNFDFYYGPVYGNRWPSIRLALLTPNKYFAILNKFASNWKENEMLMKKIGAINVLEEAREQESKLTDEKQLEPKICIETSISEEKSLESFFSDQIGPEPLHMRGKGGLTQFRQSGRNVTMDEKINLKEDASPNVNTKRIEITGFEGQYVELPKENHVLHYPNKLDIYAFPYGNLSCYPPPVKDEVGTQGKILCWWLLDGGSIAPVLALGLTEGENVLDMCAAPGGKSLLIIQTHLIGQLTCNDNKQSRLGHLHRALGQYIPVSSEIADRIILKRKDASILDTWDEISIYDKVLLDAPCTSDRLSVNRDDGNLYSSQMTEQRLNLPQVQTRMLVNALRSVRVGGCVVYSTCTLSPVQNEGVVENGVAIASTHFGIKAVELSLSELEYRFRGSYQFSDKPRRGSLILPFLPSNCGPMYMCKLQRIK
ncbi:unnamed protein product [Thelazia callipaeda]|uniref:NOL1/NOP2/Sun domain family member 4 n=1 Tax=Thelazia callipaeda TaxID=103827 RepID=A0A0N5CZI6_THECL|nr:unnamed protein product [Thelazia callipaeda]